MDRRFPEQPTRPDLTNMPGSRDQLNMAKQPAKRQRTRLMRILSVGLVLAIVVLASVSATVLVLNYTGHLTSVSVSSTGFTLYGGSG